MIKHNQTRYLNEKIFARQTDGQTFSVWTGLKINLEQLLINNIEFELLISLTTSDNLTCAKIDHPKMFTRPLIMKPL